MRLTPYAARKPLYSGRAPRIALQMRDEDVVSTLLGGAFAGCRERDLLALVHVGRQFVLPSHWTFIQEQTPAHDLYVLLDGTATVFRDRRVLARVLSGDVVGEMGLRSPWIRSASVTSSDRLRLLRIDYPTIDELLRRRPVLAARLGDIADERRSAPRQNAF